MRSAGTKIQSQEKTEYNEVRRCRNSELGKKHTEYNEV